MRYRYKVVYFHCIAKHNEFLANALITTKRISKSLILSHKSHPHNREYCIPITSHAHGSCLEFPSTCDLHCHRSTTAKRIIAARAITQSRKPKQKIYMTNRHTYASRAKTNHRARNNIQIQNIHIHAHT